MKGASGSPREGSAVALVSVVREGEIFGELTFVDAASASATVIANEVRRRRKESQSNVAKMLTLPRMFNCK